MQCKRFDLFLVFAHFFVAWSVCLSVVCPLSHSCTLLKPFDGFRCYLAGTLVGSSDIVLDGGPWNPTEVCHLGVVVGLMHR